MKLRSTTNDRAVGVCTPLRVLIPALLLALALGPTGPAVSLATGLLSVSLSERQLVAVEDGDRAAARALGEARRFLAAKDVEQAAAALERARGAALLADYVDYHTAQLLELRGDHAAAAAAAKAALEQYPESLLRAELGRLRGDALAAAGDETGACESWTTALGETDDLQRRREIKLAIVESRKRTGEIESVADSSRLVDTLFVDTALPSELPAGQRSAKMALLAADELMSKGRGEQASLAYQEALAGTLSEDERRHAQLQLGMAQFRLRRYEEAMTSFAALGSDTEARFWHARSSARAGHVTKAIAEFESLAETATPEYASRSYYLAGTLLEDRGADARAMALYEKVAGYEQFPERAVEALWRIGWSRFRRGDHAPARRRFEQMVALETDPLGELRARYWGARAAHLSGDLATGRSELESLAREYPLAYYGWRAQQQLGQIDARAQAEAEAEARPPSRETIPARELQRIALLLEAGIDEGAREELQPIAGRARTLSDHVTVGRLLAESGDYHRAQRLVVNAYSVPLSQGLQPGNELLWWLSWPPAYRELVEGSVSADAAIDPALVWAVMREESSFRPEVMSSAGARGLLQLMPETAARMAKMSGTGEFDPETLFAPETNIALGSAYLDHLAGRFPGRLSAAIGSYNAGPRAVQRWLKGDAAGLDDDVWVEDIPYGQTRSYVKRVLRSLHVYRSFY